MGGETRFPKESFKLSVSGFHGVEIRGEPGADRVKKQERDLTGVNELRMLVRPLLYWVTRSSGDERRVQRQSGDVGGEGGLGGT